MRHIATFVFALFCSATLCVADETVTTWGTASVRTVTTTDELAGTVQGPVVEANGLRYQSTTFSVAGKGSVGAGYADVHLREARKQAAWDEAAARQTFAPPPRVVHVPAPAPTVYVRTFVGPPTVYVPTTVYGAPTRVYYGPFYP